MTSPVNVNQKRPMTEENIVLQRSRSSASPRSFNRKAK